MGDTSRTVRTPTLDLHSIFGISKAASLGKVYKSLIRWHPDKNSAEGKKQEEMIISDPIVPAIFERSHHQKNEDHLLSRQSTLSKSTSRRSKTPTHSGRRSLSRSSSRRCTTPTPKSSYRSSETEFAPASLKSRKSLSRNTSRRCTTPTPKSSYRSSETEFSPASPPRLRSLSRNSSRRCTTPTPKSSYRSTETEFATASLSRNMSRKGSKTPSRAASLSRNMSRGRSNSENEIPDNCPSPTNMARNYSSESETHAPSLTRNISCKGSTPIIFSQSTVRRKPTPVEKKLECTLEELCFGGVKTIKHTRDVILNPGIIAQEEEILMIEIKPGWRKGTKITFEGKGDEKPGYLPADIVFLIDEKEHPLFKRDGDNLEVIVNIPLVNALTGCAIPVPILGGETMTLSFEDTIIYPGYEKVIPGQGMPNSKQDGRRGDLHIQFFIDFPTELSDQQREEAVSFLQDCY